MKNKNVKKKPTITNKARILFINGKTLGKK